jgi:uncharacterized protein YijF (DUF1287 family)
LNKVHLQCCEVLFWMRAATGQRSVEGRLLAAAARRNICNTLDADTCLRRIGTSLNGRLSEADKGVCSHWYCT